MGDLFRFQAREDETVAYIFRKRFVLRGDTAGRPHKMGLKKRQRCDNVKKISTPDKQS